MHRTLLLEEDDLVMVVKEDVVKQIDEHRGEMNRTEFVNYLIQCQLKEQQNQQDCISKEEYQQFRFQMLQLFRNFLEFFISYGMSKSDGQHDENLEVLSQRLASFQKIWENSGS